ncbi:hypothetical protein [Streptomyces scabiei]|uniref:hypothetical protein n=1 Tax=Streptomyces scabiei TaxID=1930 RepID=UPI0029AC7DD9|nr:hypothetical protein [Streptomyces scabiei]MDX2536114.1 hypothetical protein [Streptomyces scabiei]MDX2797183.1 hypothetical protein [Streptomyces scabiei]MDX2857396.1 hypothetical protein [Streptomyces scabiei]MDX3277341.1 hypothetical protein [Streptomyces scabiei]MDX3825800.1 hypothetical protein [Streptomyces scabiei]
MTGPYPPTGLRPEDRTDFEAALCRALDTPDIRDALRADTGGVAERRLRVRASADADTIVAAASGEYRAYLAALASGTDGPDALNGEEPGAGGWTGRTARRTADAGLLPLLAVLTPSLAACSAAVVLVLGGLLRLLGVRGTLPGSLLAAGWTLALFAATSALLALAALFRTALRGPGDPAGPARTEQARLVWQQALLHRGMLPHLRRCLREDPSLSEASPPGRPA